MRCTACGRTAAAGQPVQHDVPPITQYASPDLIGQIAYAGADPADDPGWPSSGAADQAEYARWCRHICGMACLAMTLQHRDGHAPPLLDLLRASLPFGTYRTGPDGTIRGLFYAPFVDYITDRHGLTGEVQPDIGLDDLLARVTAGDLAMASVHKEIRRPDRAAPGRGGHLVLIVGYDPGSDAVHYRNPSGHTADTRAAVLPASTFETFFARRGITIQPSA